MSFQIVQEGTASTHLVADLYANGVTQNDVIRELSNFGESSIPLIVIDEYQQFKDDKGAAYLSETIKAVSDAGVNATIIVIGVGDSVIELVRGHKSITRCSEEILMPRMEKQELQALSNVRVTPLGMRLEGDARWKIIGLAKGLPSAAHSLGRSSVYSAIARKSMTVSDKDVDKGIQDTIASSKQTLKNTGNYVACKHGQSEVR